MPGKEYQPNPEGRVYSGMPLRNSEGRRQIVEIDNKAWEKIYESRGFISRKDANKPYKKTAKIKGIHEVIEERDCIDDYNDEYRCAQYVFDTVKKEKWAKGDPSDYSYDLFYHTETFLEQKGYQVVDGEPKKGDVVGYGMTREFSNGDAENAFVHFGVWTGKDVISKFGISNVYKHDLHTAIASDTTADKVFFFRKKDQKNRKQD
jgi:hypothetical protein